MMIVSHSVFKEQKKHQRFFPHIVRSFPVGAASNLRKEHRPVNRFFKLFFEEQFPIQISLASQLVLFRTRRVIIRISVCYATRFLNYFSKNNFLSKSHSHRGGFVSNKAGKHTHKKNPRNFFHQLFCYPKTNTQKTPIKTDKTV